MNKEKELEQSLRKLIDQTNKALKEGAIYTDEFRIELEKARKALPEPQEINDTYPNPKHTFHIINQ